MKDRRVVDVPHAQRFGDSTRPLSVHLLEEYHICAMQGRIGLEQTDRPVNSPREGDVERYDPQGARAHAASLCCVGWYAGIPGTFGGRVIPSGAAAPDEDERCNSCDAQSHQRYGSSPLGP